MLELHQLYRQHLHTNLSPRFSSYSVYRRVVNYYSDDPTGKGTSEDAFDMRKSLSRDKRKKYIREDGENHRINPEDIYHG